MKKHYLKFLALFIFFINSNMYVHAQCAPEDLDCNPDPGTPPNPGDGSGDGTGGRTTPIDDYVPLLVITAITAGGLISYKQKELFKK